MNHEQLGTADAQPSTSVHLHPVDQPMDVLQVMRETRAMRRIKPDPVPPALIREVLTYATFAPSGGNSQAWKFVVVTDENLRQQIATYYAPAIDYLFAHVYPGPVPNMTVEASERWKQAIRWQREHLADIPVLIFPCLTKTRGLDFSQHMTQCTCLGAAIFPAIQNLLLACRAKGLAATLTTMHLMYREQIDALLGVPADARSCAMLPVGWPMGKFGPVRRRPVDKVIAWNHWI